jgi:hypothetical protein
MRIHEMRCTAELQAGTGCMIAIARSVCGGGGGGRLAAAATPPSGACDGVLRVCPCMRQPPEDEKKGPLVLGPGMNSRGSQQL